MTIQTDLAKRFIDTMTAKLSKAEEKGSDAVRIDLADLALLLRMAQPSADALDAVVDRMLAIADMRISGIDLSAHPDYTVISEVEIVDGKATVRESVVVKADPAGEGQATGCG